MSLFFNRVSCSLALGLSLLFLAPTSLPAQSGPLKPEKPSLKVGLPVNATSFLPAYVVKKFTGKEEGLEIELVVFRGDAGVTQALASNSIDIGLASLNGLINLITAGHKAKGFYAGFWQADFEFLARPEIKSWADAKGKSFGMTTPGSLTDHLTRYVLQKHGLTPDRDAKVVPIGPTAQALQAMQSGQLDAGIMSPPFKWQGVDMGLTSLGTQRAEVAEKWPKHVYYAQESFIAQHPNTLRALLRAHVRAIRRAKANPAETIQVLSEAVKFDPKFGKRAYDDVIEDFDERGRLPEPYMPVFWEIAKRTGDVSEPWLKEKFLDSRFIDTFEQWKP